MIFRLELDSLDAGIAALSRLPGVVSAAPAADTDPELQRIAVNLVLEEDAALGGVVTALAGIGSHILALRKSEPTLEDVFVELVGRGFGDDGAGGGDAGSDKADGQGPDGAAGSRRRDDEEDGIEDLPPSPSADEADEAYPVEAGR